MPWTRHCCFCINHAKGAMYGSIASLLISVTAFVIQCIVTFLPGIISKWRDISYAGNDWPQLTPNFSLIHLANAVMAIVCLPMYFAAKRKNKWLALPFIVLYGLGTLMNVGVAGWLIFGEGDLVTKQWGWGYLLITGDVHTCAFCFTTSLLQHFQLHGTSTLW